MDREQVALEITQLEARLEEMDAEMSKRSAEERIEYEKERDNLRGQLQGWGDMAEAEWDSFLARMKQQYADMLKRWRDG